MMAFSRSRKILPALAALSLVAVPVMTWADASAPGIDKVYKKKPKAKPRAKPRAAAVRPVAQTPPPVETMNMPPEPPAYVPEPAPAPAPAMAEAPPPPPAPPAAPLAVAKKGNGTIIALLAAAAVGAGILIASDGGSTSA